MPLQVNEGTYRDLFLPLSNLSIPISVGLSLVKQMTQYFSSILIRSHLKHSNKFGKPASKRGCPSRIQKNNLQLRKNTIQRKTERMKIICSHEETEKKDVNILQSKQTVLKKEDKICSLCPLRTERCFDRAWQDATFPPLTIFKHQA